MIYTLILLTFGVIPLLALWLAARKWIGRYAGMLFWLALMIAAVGGSWEMAAIDRLWFYAPGTVMGVRLLTIPVEEWAYYVIDALLVGTLTVVLMKVLAAREAGRNV